MALNALPGNKAVPPPTPGTGDGIELLPGAGVGNLVISGCLAFYSAHIHRIGINPKIRALHGFGIQHKKSGKSLVYMVKAAIQKEINGVKTADLSICILQNNPTLENA